MQTRVDDRLGHDRLRELPFGDLGGEPLRCTLGDPQRERGCLAAEVGHDRGHEPAADRADGPERGVTGLEALEHREVGPQVFELAADVAGPLEHERAELGRHGSPPAPAEEGDAQLLLELADLVGDVRLHRVEAIGGRGERPRVLDRQQRVEVAQLHGRPIPVSGARGRGRALPRPIV